MTYKIISSMKTRTFETEYGTFDSYAVMLDGETDAVEIVQKPQTPPPSGEISGTIETTKWGRKLKKDSQGGFGLKSDPERQGSIERQNSLTNAVNYCIAKANLDKGFKLTGKEVIQVATYFKRYNEGKVTVVMGPEAIAEAFGYEFKDTKPEQEVVSAKQEEMEDRNDDSARDEFDIDSLKFE